MKNLYSVICALCIACVGVTAIASPPPADDSNKWFVSVIEKSGCGSCKNLKNDLAASPELATLDSWAHVNIFKHGDETQDWRWKDINIVGYPTILLQPPVDKSYGDPKVLVMQQTGYNGSPERLRRTLEAAVIQHIEKYGESERSVRNPPFTVDVDVNSPAPAPAPAPAVPESVQPPALPGDNLPRLLDAAPGIIQILIASGLMSSGFGNAALAILVLLSALRTFRRQKKQLSLDGATLETIVASLRDGRQKRVAKRKARRNKTEE